MAIISMSCVKHINVGLLWRVNEEMHLEFIAQGLFFKAGFYLLENINISV